MSRVRGHINHPNGGGTAGWVGNLPIDEAFRVVQEGRLHIDVDDRPRFAVEVEMLLAGLDVDSVGELARLVAGARAVEDLCESSRRSRRMFNRSEILRALDGRA